MRTGRSPILVRLAAERATGALLCEAGVVYLVEGEVVHAESPVSPGIDVLLTTAGRLPAEEWQEAVELAGARREVGRFLVDSGRLATAELEICHLGALFDAAYFALVSGSGPRRFRHGVAHWLGPVRPVRADFLIRETERRTALLDGIWPRPEVDHAPVVRVPAGRSPAPTHRQRALLRLADGVRTPAEIARALGRPAFHTLIDVRRLAAAGHLRTPRRTPDPAAASAPPPALPGVPTEFTDEPDVALLRRIRDALEASL